MANEVNVAGLAAGGQGQFYQPPPKETDIDYEANLDQDQKAGNQRSNAMANNAVWSKLRSAFTQAVAAPASRMATNLKNIFASAAQSLAHISANPTARMSNTQVDAGNAAAERSKTNVPSRYGGMAIA